MPFRAGILETLQTGAAIRRCLEAEGILGMVRIGMEIQTTSTTMCKSTSLVSPENYVVSEWIILLRRRGEKTHKEDKDGQRCVMRKNPIK